MTKIVRNSRLGAPGTVSQALERHIVAAAAAVVNGVVACKTPGCVGSTGTSTRTTRRVYRGPTFQKMGSNHGIQESPRNKLPGPPKRCPCTRMPLKSRSSRGVLAGVLHNDGRYALPWVLHFDKKLYFEASKK